MTGGRICETDVSGIRPMKW